MAENINKNFLNPNWWKRALIKTIIDEIDKGIDVNEMDNKVLNCAIKKVQPIILKMRETTHCFSSDISNEITKQISIAHKQNEKIKKLNDKNKQNETNINKLRADIQRWSNNFKNQAANIEEYEL